LIKILPGGNKRGGKMKMKFTLNMENLDVNGSSIDTMILDWVDEVSQEQVLEMSHQWISSQTFLTERMIGLHRVGESSLTIEPIGE
jgi:hypothetical protein